MSNDIGKSWAQGLLAIISMAWSIAVSVNAYGLTIESWPWLIWGTLGTITLLAASGTWSSK